MNAPSHLQELTAPLRNVWLRRAPHERKALVYGSLLLLVLLYIWLIQAGSTARSTLQQRVVSLRSEAAVLEQQANELEQLRVASPPAASDAALLPLLSLLQESAERAGLTDLLLHSESLAADQATLTFGAIPFATWLPWIDELRTQNIRVVNARIETLSTPGLVSVTATFARPAPQ